MTKRIAIIGGGIVGLSTALRILQRFPSVQVCLFEKESGPGRHQTGHNSGVLHCGLYYKPGSVKARLAVQGIRRMVEFCAQNGVPYELCGKIVVATTDEEIPRLKALFERGTTNGLQGLQMLSAEQIREFEPYAAGLAGLRVPQEGIVDYAAVAEAMAREIRRLGGEIRFSEEVTQLTERGAWRVQTSSGEHEADFIINCAGLHSDRICRNAGAQDSTKIVPFRGEYYKLVPDRQFLVRNLIYPVPDPNFPFLGVHFTRLIRGGVEAGPNAVLAFAREGYAHTDFSMRDMVETLTYRGFWRFLLKYPSMCWDEFLRSYSKNLFCRSLQRLVPDLRIEDLSSGGAGVRAQALSTSGELVQDFYFVRQARALHVLNAPSPAATASLAIADEIIDRVQEEIAARPSQAISGVQQITRKGDAVTSSTAIRFLDLVTLHSELEEELCSLFKQSLRTAGFIGGPMVEGFETDFAKYCAAQYCVGVGSGTDALRFALMAAGVPGGSIVVTVPNTFIATSEAISQAGATPFFVDVDKHTYNMDPEELRNFLESECVRTGDDRRTVHRATGMPVSAVIPVHLYGQMAEMDVIEELAEQYNLFVIEDACQAHGAQYFSQKQNRWRTAGSIGKAAAFSFYPGKNLGACGEGGAITTNDPELAQRARMLRDHGQSKKYYHDLEGYNGRLDSIQAGILKTKLPHLPEWNTQRRTNAARYNNMLSSVADSIQPPYEPSWSQAVYHLYVVQVEERDAVRQRLNAAGVETGIHYPIPLHLQKAYSKLGYGRGAFPVAEAAAERILSLPMYPGLTAQQQQHVVEALSAAAQESARDLSIAGQVR